MDVAILCGGYATRLAGLWDGPKALVPLGDGQPILFHLLRRVRLLHPRQTMLLTGHKNDDILKALRGASLLSPHLFIQNGPPQGTGVAVRSGLRNAKPPLLVLNGDTLPRYDLWELRDAFDAAQPDIMSAWCGGKPAGATLLSRAAFERLRNAKDPDFDDWVSRQKHVINVGVRGFLDVGTPHGFDLAKRWTEL